MTSLLPPREIQARVRAGETPEDLATAAQTTVEKIMVYAGPVLAERAHVAGLALAASVRRSSEQGGARVLEESVDAQLRAAAVDPASVEWDAWRGLDQRWNVVADVPVDGTVRRAAFHYDLSSRSVVAEDDMARWLTGEVPQRPGVRAASPAHDDPAAAGVTDTAGDAPTGGEIPLPPAPAERTLRSVHPGDLAADTREAEDADDDPVLSGVDAPARVPGDPAVPDLEGGAEEPEGDGQLALGDDAIALVTGTAATRPATGPAPTWRTETSTPSWLDGPRPAATPPPSAPMPVEPDQSVEPAEAVPETVSPQEALFGDPAGTDAEPDGRGRGGRKRGRATIPSWDEIMFGGPSDGAPLAGADGPPRTDDD